MITRLVVKSFKSLESLDIELGRINVFIGANGSGKSNLLEAVGVLGAAASGRVDDESLLRRGVRPGPPSLYKSSFRNSRQTIDIRFEAFSEDASYEIGLFNPLKDPKPGWRYHTEKLVGLGEKIVGRSHNTHERLNPESGLAALKLVDLDENHPAAKLLSELREYSIFSPNTQTLRGLIPDAQQREPLGLSGGRLPQAVIETLIVRTHGKKHVVNLDQFVELIEWSESIGIKFSGAAPVSQSVPTPRFVLQFRDKYMAEKRDLLTAYDASEGALYVLFLAALALHPRSSPIVAVDNVDSALNPRLARALISTFCSAVLDNPGRESQFLLTAHNPLVLDGLPIHDDRVRLFTVDRTEKGKTFVQRIKINDDMLTRAKEGWTLSRLWVMGQLGGVPNV